MTEMPRLSIIVPTYNRRDMLRRTLDSVLRQTASMPFELIVVDNASTDGTLESVAEIAANDARVRVLAESRQGVTYARNTAIDAARAEVFAFLDDDVIAAPDWLHHVQQYLDEFALVDCFGGKVLPQFGGAPPPWLNQRHWGPLGAAEYGDAPFLITLQNQRCLLAGNLVVRRTAFDRAGRMSPRLQRVGAGIGSLEDHEWQLRLLKAGGTIRYCPGMVAYTEVPPGRLQKEYHRRWHRGHGYFSALLEHDFFEATGRKLFGVPGWVWRDGMTHASRLVAKRLTGNPEAFGHELRLRWLFGYTDGYRECQRT